MAQQTQPETRSERSTVTLTPSEKAALRLVVAIDETDEVSVLRDQTVAQIMARADAIRAKVGA